MKKTICNILLVCSFFCSYLLSQTLDEFGAVEHISAINQYGQYNNPFDPSGWSNDTILSENDGDESVFPDIVVDSNKHIHVIWKDNGSPKNGIYYRKNDGANWSTIIDLSDPGINSNSPTIAVDAENNIHVVFLRWSGEPGLNYNVSYRRFDDSTGIWGQEWVITTDDSLYLCAQPKVVTDSSMSVYVFWLDERDTPKTIWYKVNDGTSWGPDTRVTDNTASPNGFFGVTVSPNDYVHICWQDYRGGNGEIYHKFFDGSSWSSEERVTNNVFSSVYPRMAPDSSNNIHLFYGGISNLHYLMWDKTTQTWGNGKDFPSAFAYPHADIAVDLLTSDRHIVFAEHIGYSAIFYKKYDASTGTWEMDIQLTSTTDGSYEPQVATDTDNLVYVTWFDYRCGTGQEEIYFKQTLPTGLYEEDADIIQKGNTISVYPNPFSNRVEIRYCIGHPDGIVETFHGTSSAEGIELNIYDISGRRIRTLVTGDLCTGALVWDGKNSKGGNVPRGVYFYKLESKRFSSDGKLVKIN